MLVKPACRTLANQPRWTIGRRNRARVTEEIRRPKSEDRKKTECRNPKMSPSAFCSGGACKVAPRWYLHDPFPLTPALSLRERENQGQRYENCKRLDFANALPPISLS